MSREHAWIVVDLEADHHLEPVAPDTWDAVGNDPRFTCAPRVALAGGWYEFELELECLGGPDMWAYFYPDYGGHELEPAKVYLPFEDRTARVQRGLVLFVQDVRHLRFDPAAAICRFRLGGLRLRRVGRWDAAVTMLGAIARRPGGVGTACATLAKAARAGLSGGPRGAAAVLYARYAERPEDAASVPYSTWVALYDQDSETRLQVARREAAQLPRRPTFSVILPVYNTAEEWLRRCVKSVQDQVYGDWELCVSNDASPDPRVRKVLDGLAASDPRIRVVHRDTNGHISANSNSAIALASGEWLVLLDHDDELHPHALLEMAKAIVAHPRWRVIYSDEDKVDEAGRRFDPYMKPDWNYDLFLSHNCISHLGVYHAALVRDVGGFLEGMEGSQDWDLALRCIERLAPDQVGHVPKVLYHWRAIAGSTALAPQEKDYAHDAGLRAIAGHLARIGSPGRVVEIPGQRGNYRVVYPTPVPTPLVSIIIPTRDRVDLLRACIESVLASTSYPAFEILVVDNQSTERDALAYLEAIARDDRIRVLAYDAPFNYSAINNYAASQARGEVLCLLNNDITVITPGWLEEMAGHACREQVGAVGAMLYYPNDTIQHAGVVIGAHGIAAHAYSGQGRGYPGHMSRARLVQSLSAVTAACLVVRRDAFEAVGGLDPALEVAFNDVDFCLRLLEKGYRNVWTPFAELYHHESASRGYEDSPEKLARFNREVAYMRRRWADMIAHDPAYSPNFSTTDTIYELAFPPRLQAWRGPAAQPTVVD